MAKITIKKRVDLGFLGEDYKEGYLVFKAAGIDEFAEIEKKSQDPDALKFIKDFLGGKFLEGKFPDVEDENKLQDFDKDDIGKLDPETILVIFQVLGGGIASDPKGQNN